MPTISFYVAHKKYGRHHSLHLFSPYQQQQQQQTTCEQSEKSHCVKETRRGEERIELERYLECEAKREREWGKELYSIEQKCSFAALQRCCVWAGDWAIGDVVLKRVRTTREIYTRREEKRDFFEYIRKQDLIIIIP